MISFSGAGGQTVLCPPPTAPQKSGAVKMRFGFSPIAHSLRNTHHCLGSLE